MWISLLIILAILFYASYNINSGIYVKAKCKLKEKSNAVALTFDDGVDLYQTPKVLEVLKRHNVKATFFIIGEKAERNPEIVEAILAGGHKIGIHTYSHKGTFPLLSYVKTYEEIKKTQVILEKISKQPVTLFRPPFGVTNPNIGKVVKKINLQTIGWSIRSYDTNMSRERLEVVNKIVKKIKGNDIILLHDDRKDSDVLVDELLNRLKIIGYQTVLV